MKSLNLAALLVLAACGAQQGPSGANGSNGTNGADGRDGFNGHSAVVKLLNTSTCVNGGKTIMTATDSNDNGVLDSLDSNIMTSEVCNGLNGTDGQDGQDAAPSAFLPVELLNPCGVNGNYDEVLLKLSSGIVLASFSENSNGKNTRFSVLQAHADYQTTDGDSCKFRIDDEGELYNERH